MGLALLLGAGACTPPHPASPADTGFAMRVSGTPVRIEATPVRCADPSARQQDGPFRAWTSADWSAQPVADPPGGFVDHSGWGMVVADLDGDGHLDLFLPGFGTNALWSGDGEGGLEPRPPPPDQSPALSQGSAAGDLDGDGDLDLVVGQLFGDQILLSDGAGGLQGHAMDPALATPDAGRYSTTLADIDGDGDLDAFLPVFGELPEGDAGATLPPGPPSRLALNRGDGTFEDGSDRLPGETNDGYPFTAAFVDMDDDGDPDLVLANDHGSRARPTRHWRNDGGVFVDVSEETGLDLRLTAMGLGIGDLDGDGVPSLAVTGTREIALMEDDGTGTFVHTEAARGLQPDLQRGQHVGWGIEMGDVDNDGRLDVLTGYGWFPADPGQAADQPDALSLQQEDGHFVDVAPEWGLDHTGWTRGALLVDLDGDGWLDVVRRHLYEPPSVQLARCGAAGWVSVALRDAGPNTHGIGARVRVMSGGRPQTRQILAGGHSLASAGPPRVHFGLGGDGRIDRLQVRWPDGAETEIHDIEPRQHLVLERAR